ncbi:MAG: hypothetical protein EON54_11605 [Alcaligenaceae bacterium]|nr:MAG: hypothetical protein EON54_11605 [Alcaligenaceae bacterium]
MTVLPSMLTSTSKGLFFKIFWAFLAAMGFPPKEALNITSGSYLGLALFLFLLPEAKKIKFGQIFEYEAKVKEIKEDVKQFKDETRTTLLAYTSLVSAISNTVSQNINVNLPGAAEATQAKEDLDTTLRTKEGRGEIEDRVEKFLAAEGNDFNYALAALRMKLEKELRRILGKSEDLLTGSNPHHNPRYLSARSLFLEFSKLYPAYEGISSSFDFVLRVCNAAIHGQFLPEKYANEALSMGFRMLSELRTITEKNPEFNHAFAQRPN